ncbi:MAG: PhnD/SsuA/transferrin family substrate-binding protein [Geobacteraceae bacterium]|nr:PhnD/SsuA/transferrin family substrate-binding protein [Geobacteraceae bacterium]
MSFLKFIIATCTTSLLCLLSTMIVQASGVDHDKERPLVIGYSNQAFYNVDPRDAIGLTTVWVQNADRRMGNTKETKVVFFRDLADAEKALKANEVDIIILLAEEFFLLRDRVPLTPVLSADYGRHFYDELLLMVRADSNITRIDQLRQKNIRIESGQKGKIPMMWLNAFLMGKVSCDTRHFFSTINSNPKASQVIMPLFFGQTDACLASRSSFETMSELNPQLGQKLRILEKSPGFITGMVAVRRDILNPRRDAMVETIRDIGSHPRGRQLLTLFKINRVVEYREEHLTAINSLLRTQRDKIENTSRKKR